MNWKDEIAARTAQVEQIIQAYLPEEKGYQKHVIEAMNYSMLAGGKRLRPMFLQEAYRMFGGTGKEAEPFMAAIEMIHTYSLVHDDLPCMDNDEYRRGRKSTWAQYGEVMAVLAGDGLLTYAFETAAKAFALSEHPDRVGRAIGILAKKAGIDGMLGGQTADIEAEEADSEVTEELLLFIHEYKTAALIQNALMIGAVLAGAKEEVIQKMERIGYLIGIAFQIQDDILDVTSSLEVLGKQTGSDEKNNKATYVTLKGLEQAVEDQKKLSEEAVGLLASFEQKNEFLEKLVEQLITREK
ncbi:MAG: polyprenyl synthetase family protein [Clostridiales bacterium]|nr:polyprenyl synthetase family protein [Clostridiales bacterium]